MIPPSPELLRKYRNTREIVESGRSYLLQDLIVKYPGDYIDLATYESMRNAMQLI